MWSSVALAALNAALALSAPSGEARTKCCATRAWSGWKNVKHAFIFGDSYTQTGFNYQSTNPSPSNPLGNPPYPGWTSSNGPNWVGFLTTKHNASLLQTYNFAYGGATVDSDLVAPYDPSVVSMKEQVRSQFLPGYTGDSPSAPGAPSWTGKDSVFAFWIGINDVGNSWWLAPAERGPLYARIFELYAALAAQLREQGARNFVFVNVPPVDRSPLMIGQGPENAAAERAVIAEWNARVADLAAALKAAGPDEVDAWVYDANASYEAALDDPTVFEATAELRNVTGYCEAYQNGTPAWDTLIESCGVPVNQYFWLNNLHPTYPIHDVVAKGVAEALAAGPNVC
ncbi:hypothetical protein DL764_004316 [Monosporascus ibericus]|uniref:Uncharacterized protein n=1 Tax=Monosporascus ibericus TaxID=155417 RepID=A0A4Q4TFV2_9PEZI|nr:hypothetical protein DL764_004316 [Monosporascus ibericus]